MKTSHKLLLLATTVVVVLITMRSQAPKSASEFITTQASIVSLPEQKMDTTIKNPQGFVCVWTTYRYH